MKSILRATLAFAALVATASASGCVASRPARNGVFNENVYFRKDFLVRPGEAAANGKPVDDSGWYLVTTITETSSPNPLGDLNFFAGAHSIGNLVRFRVTQDHLEMVDMKELSALPSQGKTPMVLDSWNASNVDLKYRVNLDGEQTNFYEENQELPWEQRQWVKLNPAKNDLSDVNALGMGMPDLLNHCASVGEATTSLLPESVEQVQGADPTQDYLSWSVQVTVPLRTDLAECIDAYGAQWQPAVAISRPNVTMNLKYSMRRAVADSALTYKPLVLAEKDPIWHKYGPLTWYSESRDETSGMLASRELVLRFDPAKDIVWYFDSNFPLKYKTSFCTPPSDAGSTKACADSEPAGAATIRAQTNAILVASGAKHADGTQTVVEFKNNNEDLEDGAKPRAFGDVRYHWLRWMSDRDMQSSFAGVTEPAIDPRTAEILSNTIVFNDFAIKDYYVQRIDAFLQSIGAAPANGVNAPGEWADGPSNCKDGDTLPIVATDLQAVNAKNTLFSKMQQYLNRPASAYGALGPSDFIQPQDDDFRHAYYALAPYEIFADPDMNPYVVREGGKGVYGPDAYWKMMKDEAEFHQRAADIDHGKDPYSYQGPNGLANAASFLNRMRELTTNHHNLERAKVARTPYIKRDAPDAFSFEQIIARDARHCVAGKWETKAEWVQNLIDTYWTQVIWHEFGHAMGLEHNFMGSVDQPNFPTYKDGAGRTRYSFLSNSVMEYNAAPDRVFWHQGWAPYDTAAIGWIYANSCKDNSSADCTDGSKSGTAISGQSSATSPWKDPLGFANGQEVQFLRCDEHHLAYTPLCHQGDMGTTPSEIIANQIISSEWGYNWRNFRVYRKFWDNSRYADVPATMLYDMKRFLSLWVYDWSGGELADNLRRIGVKNPDPNGSDLQYFNQLTNKFNAELSSANQMVAAYHKGIIQQGSGERPFGTVYDKFFGDVTQQGIILDKLFAMQSWVGLWPADNYDQNQAGAYFAGYEGLGDSTFNSVAEDAVDSMVGGQYNVYPYFRPLAVTQFAQDTHSPAFGGRVDVRDWIGGQVFNRVQDFLEYFRNIAVQNNQCNDLSTCLYDPRVGSDPHNEFVGPDKRVWIWSYIPDRNQYVAVLKDRNTASYIIVRAYNDDVVTQLDDGAYPGSAYGLELPMKYFLDAYTTYR